MKNDGITSSKDDGLTRSNSPEAGGQLSNRPPDDGPPDKARLFARMNELASIIGEEDADAQIDDEAHEIGNDGTGRAESTSDPVSGQPGFDVEEANRLLERMIDVKSARKQKNADEPDAAARTNANSDPDVEDAVARLALSSGELTDAVKLHHLTDYEAKVVRRVALNLVDVLVDDDEETET